MERYSEHNSTDRQFETGELKKIELEN